jgi:hypothetical protein
MVISSSVYQTLLGVAAIDAILDIVLCEKKKKVQHDPCHMQDSLRSILGLGLCKSPFVASAAYAPVCFDLPTIYYPDVHYDLPI